MAYAGDPQLLTKFVPVDSSGQPISGIPAVGVPSINGLIGAVTITGDGTNTVTTDIGSNTITVSGAGSGITGPATTKPTSITIWDSSDGTAVSDSNIFFSGNALVLDSGVSILNTVASMNDLGSIDKPFNNVYANNISAPPPGPPSVLLDYLFDGNLNDNSGNGYDAIVSGPDYPVFTSASGNLCSDQGQTQAFGEFAAGNTLSIPAAALNLISFSNASKVVISADFIVSDLSTYPYLFQAQGSEVGLRLDGTGTVTIYTPQTGSLTGGFISTGTCIHIECSIGKNGVHVSINGVEVITSTIPASFGAFNSLFVIGNDYASDTAHIAYISRFTISTSLPSADTFVGGIKSTTIDAIPRWASINADLIKDSNVFINNNGGLYNNNSSVLGINSIAMGNNLIASGNNSQAFGEDSQSLGDASHSEGSITAALGYASHAEGRFSTSIGQYSHAEGQNTQSIGDNSHAEGLNTIASGTSSHSEGHSTNSIGDNAHAEGDTTTALGLNSHAEGNGTIALGNASHAQGQNTQAFNDYSHAEGSFTVASGNASHAEGGSSIAFGTISHAEGNGTQSIGYASHAEGQGSFAFGNFSHAEGSSSIASGTAAHSEGLQSLAIGDYSHAENTSFSAGIYSHSEGQISQALGDISHAQGYGSIASGNTSFAAGTNALALHDYSTVITDQNGASSSVENQMTLSFVSGVIFNAGTVPVLTDSDGVRWKLIVAPTTGILSTSLY